jgi:phosphoenolpyruvate synthase/pyruvate phosphate dikinase
VWSYELAESQPNFITQGKVMGVVVGADVRNNLRGAIVCIPNADPGYDWIFGHPIAGFITAWGGANSHMAIRASELGLPAVIGAGDLLYRKWSNSGKLEIDCASQKVEIIS